LKDVDRSVRELEELSQVLCYGLGTLEVARELVEPGTWKLMFLSRSSRAEETSPWIDLWKNS
jgi:hypothetical protein